MKTPTYPTAVVMNMYYTGLGIARSLGRRGIPVIGLSAQRMGYGNFTRFAKIVHCPDSRHEPEALLTRLQALGKEIGHRSVIFPTRDDDLVFLDRYREALEPYFILAVPERAALNICLSKWETYLWAEKTGVATPKCWFAETEEEVRRIAPGVTYPCVAKPVAAHHWRQGGNWGLVGGRKAICVSSPEELLAEYALIARADQRVLLQEMIPGEDDCLVIAACYLDRDSNWVAGFNTQKLVQSPEGFGTGCIVQSVDRPELFAPTLQLLQGMRFSGIAEVEYKWDSRTGSFRLIEINPRAWDQHILGGACGVDLTYFSYCEHAGLPVPVAAKKISHRKWIAEDAFFMAALQYLWRRDPKLVSLFRRARGKRIYAIWSVRDPLPSLAYVTTYLLPELVRLGARSLWSVLSSSVRTKAKAQQEPAAYGSPLEKGVSRD